ncbi:hypothetical protein BH23ACI1_BH23ACI1_24230 [soil metagenome]|nr:hypothetical protein [Acidobacteriota bacterium]
MSDIFNAVLLALAWFAAVNAVLSLVAWAWARHGRVSLNASAGALLAHRLLPAGGSAFFVLVFFAPAHWRFEPRGGEESFGVVVHALAAAGLALLAPAFWRAAAALRAGWELRSCDGLPRIDAAADLEVYEVDGLAGVSLAGIVRPRILVGLAVREALTPDELDAAVAHEVAHGASRDNWKRLAIYCAPDLFGHTAAARHLEVRWSAVAECHADARAVAGDRARATDLAAALLKVARLAGQAPRSPAWSTLHDEPLLAARVLRLLGGTPPSAPRPAGILMAGGWFALVLALAFAGTSAAYELHILTETVAHFLP